MTFSNNPHLRRYLMEGGLAHLAVYASFEFEPDALEERLNQVRTQHPYLDADEAAARAAYRMLAASAKKNGGRHSKASRIAKHLGIRFWLIVAAIVAAGLLAGYFCSAHAAPTPDEQQRFLRVVGNAMRGVSLLPAPQQPSGIIVQFRNGGSTLATRPAGLVVLDCTTNMSCSFSGNTFTLTSSATGATAWSAITAGTNAGQALLVGNGSTFGPTGTGTITSTAFTPAGTLGNCVEWGSSGALADAGGACGSGGAPAFTDITTGTNTTATMTVGAGGTLTFSTTGIVNADRINGVEFTNSEGLVQIPIGQGDGTAVWADPLVQGLTAHDAAGASTNPVAVGGFASAAAPTDVSADTDIVRGWFLRNGAQAVNLTAAGALLPGDATSGLLVNLGANNDVTVTGTVTATGPLTDAELRATPVPVSGTVTVTDGAGALNVIVDSSALPTGAATSANQTTEITSLQLIDNLPVAQGSTTSGQSGALIQGAVTTAAPSYTTAQTSPLSLTTSGELRVAGTFNAGIVQVNDAADAAQNVGYFTGDLNLPTQNVTDGATAAAVPTWATMVGGTDGTNLRAISVSAAGVVDVSCGDCSGSGVSHIDDAAFTPAMDDVVPIAGAFDDTTPDSVNEGDAGVVRMSANRNLYTTLRDAAGNERGVNVTAGNALTVDGSATTQPVSGTVTANLAAGTNNIGDVDVASIAAGDNNIGNVDVASLPNVTVGAFPDNEPFNQAQVGGVAVFLDPCLREAKSYVSFNQTANTQVASGTASERIYICSIHIVTATAQNVAVVSGTGTTCGTSTSGVGGFGGATAATGWNFAANGGLTLGNGASSLGETDTDADNVCVFQSGSGQLSGGMSYVSN